MLICLTFNHKNIDFDKLNSISAESEKIVKNLRNDLKCLKGIVPLNTCNRVEYYLQLENKCSSCATRINDSSPANCPVLQKIVNEKTGGENKEYIYSDKTAEHLFRTVSGLESVVLGEDQITGQVSRALESARKNEYTSNELELLFQTANSVPGKIKPKISSVIKSNSMVGFSLDLVESRIQDWTKAKVLIVGSGETAKLAFTHLQELGVKYFFHYSQSGFALAATPVRDATKIAEVSKIDLDNKNLEFDLIFSATRVKNNQFIFDENSFSIKNTFGKPIIIDLGVPNNVDPKISKKYKVDLLNIDLIKRHITYLNIPEANSLDEIISKELENFDRKFANLKLGKEKTLFKKKFNSFVEQEISAANKRFKNENPEMVSEVIKHIAGRFRYEIGLKEKKITTQEDIEKYKNALDFLFDIRIEE